MKQYHLLFPLGLVVLFAFIHTNASAQEFRRPGNINAQGTAYYVFSQMGEATVQVLLLGGVPAPGVYEVGVSIELDELLTLAGGSDIGRDARVTVRLYQENNGRRELTYEGSLEHVLEEPRLFPPLREGDVVTVESRIRTRFAWQDGLAILTSLTSIAVLFQAFGGGG